VDIRIARSKTQPRQKVRDVRRARQSRLQQEQIARQERGQSLQVATGKFLSQYESDSKYTVSKDSSGNTVIKANAVEYVKQEVDTKSGTRYSRGSYVPEEIVLDKQGNPVKIIKRGTFQSYYKDRSSGGYTANNQVYDREVTEFKNGKPVKKVVNSEYVYYSKDSSSGVSTIKKKPFVKEEYNYEQGTKTSRPKPQGKEIIESAAKPKTDGQKVTYYTDPKTLNKTYRVGNAPPPKGYVKIEEQSYNAPAGSYTAKDVKKINAEIKKIKKQSSEKVTQKQEVKKGSQLALQYPADVMTGQSILTARSLPEMFRSGVRDKFDLPYGEAQGITVTAAKERQQKNKEIRKQAVAGTLEIPSESYVIPKKKETSETLDTYKIYESMTSSEKEFQAKQGVLPFTDKDAVPLLLNQIEAGKKIIEEGNYIQPEVFTEQERYRRDQLEKRQEAQDVLREGFNFDAAVGSFVLGAEASIKSTVDFGQQVFTQNPEKTVSDVSTGIVDVGERLVTGKGFPEVAEVVVNEPEFALGFVGGEIAQGYLGGAIGSDIKTSYKGWKFERKFKAWQKGLDYIPEEQVRQKLTTGGLSTSDNLIQTTFGADDIEVKPLEGVKREVAKQKEFSYLKQPEPSAQVALLDVSDFDNVKIAEAADEVIDLTDQSKAVQVDDVLDYGTGKGKIRSTSVSDFDGDISAGVYEFSEIDQPDALISVSRQTDRRQFLLSLEEPKKFGSSLFDDVTDDFIDIRKRLTDQAEKNRFSVQGGQTQITPGVDNGITVESRTLVVDATRKTKPRTTKPKKSKSTNLIESGGETVTTSINREALDSAYEAEQFLKSELTNLPSDPPKVDIRDIVSVPNGPGPTLGPTSTPFFDDVSPIIFTPPTTEPNIDIGTGTGTGRDIDTGRDTDRDKDRRQDQFKDSGEDIIPGTLVTQTPTTKTDQITRSILEPTERIKRTPRTIIEPDYTTDTVRIVEPVDDSDTYLPKISLLDNPTTISEYKPPIIPPEEPGPTPNTPALTPPLSFNQEPDQDVRLAVGYDVYVRKKRKDVKVNKQALTRESALSKGARLVDSTPAVTFKIRPNKKAKTVVNTKDKYFRDKEYKFRNYSLKTGKRYEDTWFEKNKYRIDSPGERKGITKKGQRARKSKPLLGSFNIKINKGRRR